MRRPALFRRSPSASMILLAAGLGLLAGVTPGCTSPGPAYDRMVRAVDVFANQTGGPALEQYLAEDATLDDSSRQIRTGELRSLRSAVAAAKAERGL